MPRVGNNLRKFANPGWNPSATQVGLLTNTSVIYKLLLGKHARSVARRVHRQGADFTMMLTTCSPTNTHGTHVSTWVSGLYRSGSSPRPARPHSAVYGIAGRRFSKSWMTSNLTAFRLRYERSSVSHSTQSTMPAKVIQTAVWPSRPKMPELIVRKKVLAAC